MECADCGKYTYTTYSKYGNIALCDAVYRNSKYHILPCVFGVAVIIRELAVPVESFPNLMSDDAVFKSFDKIS